MFAEVLVVSELVGAVTVAVVQGPRAFRSYKNASPAPFAPVPMTAPPQNDGGVYTLPPVVITPDGAPVPAVDCKAKIDAYVATLPDMTRDVIREAILIGNAMQIDALATAVEKSDPALAACLRAQKKD